MTEVLKRLNPLPERRPSPKDYKMSPMSQNLFRTTMWGLGIMLAHEPALNAAQITGEAISEISPPLAVGVRASTYFGLIYGAARTLDYGALAIIQEGTPEGEERMGKIKDVLAVSAGAAVGYGIGIGASEVTFLYGQFITQNSSPLTPEINNIIGTLIKGSWTLAGAGGAHLARKHYSKIRDFFAGQSPES